MRNNNACTKYQQRAFLAIWMVNPLDWMSGVFGHLSLCQDTANLNARLTGQKIVKCSILADANADNVVREKKTTAMKSTFVAKKHHNSGATNGGKQAFEKSV